MWCVLGTPLWALLLAAPLFGYTGYAIYREVQRPPEERDDWYEKYYLLPVFSFLAALLVVSVSSFVLKAMWWPYDACLLGSQLYSTRYALDFDVTPATADVGPVFQVNPVQNLSDAAKKQINELVMRKMRAVPGVDVATPRRLKRIARQVLARRGVSLKVMGLIDKALGTGPNRAESRSGLVVYGARGVLGVAVAAWMAVVTLLAVLPLSLVLLAVVGIVGVGLAFGLRK